MSSLCMKLLIAENSNSTIRWFAASLLLCKMDDYVVRSIELRRLHALQVSKTVAYDDLQSVLFLLVWCCFLLSKVTAESGNQVTRIRDSNDATRRLGKIGLLYAQNLMLL